MSGERITITFLIHLPQLKSVLPQLKYNSLCDSSNQNVPFVLSTISTGVSCLPFFQLQLTKHLVLFTVPYRRFERMQRNLNRRKFWSCHMTSLNSLKDFGDLSDCPVLSESTLLRWCWQVNSGGWSPTQTLVTLSSECNRRGVQKLTPTSLNHACIFYVPIYDYA